MTPQEMKKIDLELRRFASDYCTPPPECRNLEQIRTHVRMLCLKIEEFESRFHYVPRAAYVLLAKYNARQNRIINNGFRQTYC